MFQLFQLPKRLRFAKAALACVLCAITACSLAGCGNEPAQKSNVAIIVGNVANSAPIDVTSTLSQYISLPASSNAYIALLMPDGCPNVQYSTTVPEIDSSYSKNKQHSILTQYVGDLSVILNGMQPTCDEVNLADSLQLAARSLKAQATEGSAEYLAVAHSGLSTVGGIDFTKGLLQLDEAGINEFIAYLEASNEIADLSNITVVWYGLGDVASPQQALSQAERGTLQSIWQAYFDAAGAEDITFKLDVSGAPATSADLRYVTPIETKGNSYTPTLTEPQIFDSTQIAFEPNSAEFVDAQAALSSLSDVIAFANANPDQALLLAGTTAKFGEAQSSKALSLARADSVKALLVEQHVPDSQILTMGLGYESIYYQEDLDEKGVLIEHAANKNRAVIVLPYTGQTPSDFAAP